MYVGEVICNAPTGTRGEYSEGELRTDRNHRRSWLEDAPGCLDLEMTDGETITTTCCGSTGHGSFLAREPERVNHDVAKGCVSRERVTAIYGIIISAGGIIR